MKSLSLLGLLALAITAPSGFVLAGSGNCCPFSGASGAASCPALAACGTGATTTQAEACPPCPACPATGAGANVAAANDASDTQQSIPGGAVPESHVIGMKKLASPSTQEGSACSGGSCSN
jgi:hypothetical protein